LVITIPFPYQRVVWDVSLELDITELVRICLATEKKGKTVRKSMSKLSSPEAKAGKRRNQKKGERRTSWNRDAPVSTGHGLQPLGVGKNFTVLSRCLDDMF
jgi:hypothetical protein